MRLVCDENIQRPALDALRAAGHEVESIQQLAAGSLDEDVLELARRIGAILVTEALDFGQLAIGRSFPTFGVVLLRLHGLASNGKSRRLLEVLRDRDSELIGAFTVVSTSHTRSRRFDSLPGA